MELALEKIIWGQVRDQVCKANKELFQIIEALDPPKNQTLIKARYRFGDCITRDGITYLPKKNGELLPIAHPDVPVEIQKLLGYSPIPLFMILEKSCEVFAHVNNRIIPLNFCFAGQLLGLFEALDFLTHNSIQPIWSVSAGARSLFMLPRIAENQGINKLRKLYKLPTTLPLKNFSDQWQVFNHIARQENFGEPWTCEVLFFPNTWLSTKHHEPWSIFHQYITTDCWRQIQKTNTISHIESSITWQSFTEAIENRNLSPRPYIVDTVKHLFSIARGRFPAFIPADNTERIAPTNKLQEIFTDVYGIKDYYPSFMYAHHLSASSLEANPVYYSLSLPTLLDGTPEKNKIARIMRDLRELKLLIDTFWERSEWVRNSSSLQHISFNFFHTEIDSYGEIQNTELIAEEDKRFLHNNLTNNKFCMFSHFWRGCIKIKSEVK